jgi:hypothetical protein
MRTEEEAKYNLNEQIFDLYDGGMSVENISRRLSTSLDYITSALGNAPVEAD